MDLNKDGVAESLEDTMDFFKNIEAVKGQGFARYVNFHMMVHSMQECLLAIAESRNSDEATLHLLRADNVCHLMNNRVGSWFGMKDGEYNEACQMAASGQHIVDKVFAAAAAKPKKGG